MIKADTKHYIEDDKLEEFASETALTVEEKGVKSCANMAKKTCNALKNIKNRVYELSESSGETAEGAAEWLLDNWYMAEREGKESAKIMRSAGKIPAGMDGRLTAVRAAAALVISGLGKVTSDRIYLFLKGFQKKRVLEDRELYIFIPAVKSSLVVLLSTVCERLGADGRKAGELEFITENIFNSLRFLSGFDPSEILEDMNMTERELRQDPAGVYPLMDEYTRRYYRHTVAKRAEKEKIGGRELAKQIVQCAKAHGNEHIGKYIFPEKKAQRRARESAYIGGIVLFSLFITILAGIALKSAPAAILLLFPVSEMVKNLTDFFVMKFVRPRRVPRMDFSDGVPGEYKTLCVISALLGNADGIKDAFKRLEEYRLANRNVGENLLFGILGDFPEADRAEVPEDAEKMAAAVSEAERLNKKYGGGFYLLLRDRKYNPSSDKYMGYERKRGAIEALVKKLRGGTEDIRCCAGDENGLLNVKYIITLDSDTRLNISSAAELIGGAAHPMNRPVIDEKRGIVVSGHGILQPRISVELTAANRSNFSKIFAGQGGLDPYGSVASDVYQDMFGSGSFNGKGIIDVDAYGMCLVKRFRENRVLSHDLLEGAFLNCGYIGDVELTDGFPYKTLSYFQRMNRWIRGDWQNIGWLFDGQRDGDGKGFINPLGSLDRWKIFDNIRRSLVPVFTFAALMTGLLSRGVLSWLTLFAIMTYMSDMLISSVELMFKRESETRARYHSAIIPGFAGVSIKTFLRLILLPYEAWTSLSAICTAMYRLLISKKNLLNWVTAADAESAGKNTVWRNYTKMWSSVISGLALIAVSGPAGAAVGIIWAFSPLCSYSLSLERKRETTLSVSDKMLLRSSAGDIWRYFEDNMTEQNNWLPPDNIQEKPMAAPALRTSPTNMGYGLMAALSAYDLGLITVEKFAELVGNSLRSMEGLEKWNGHFYNWYDIRTAAVMKPEYVSSVDSGNLYGCLVVLRAALEELGLPEEAKICRSLCANMDFSVLYDKQRKLFHIGWDGVESKLSEGWYDLMESEARQTSFIAIAKGDVSKKHWTRLGRALVSIDDYSGMVSWTGTMFEYLMPNLIMPCYENSSIYESSKFCVYAQKKCGKKYPWGISESAFYAFDPGMNYQYKAHGVQRLALKRKMGTERVVSPYSTFLALSVTPKSAIKNLCRLRKMGMEGKYGFYEAADFTPIRQSGGKFQRVRTFMAHHLGMSITAIDNALNGNIMPRRFMRDIEMSAYRELLQEKVPVGQVVLRQAPREIPEKPPRIISEGWKESFAGVDFKAPRCSVMSNGVYSVILSENGQTRSMWDGRAVTRFSGSAEGAGGMAVWIKAGEELLPLTPWPDYDGSVSYKTEFSGKYCGITAEKGDITAKMTVSLPNERAGEKREIYVKYRGRDRIRAEIICIFEPVLERSADYEAHPAFSKLALHAEKTERGITVERREKGNGHGAFMSFTADRAVYFATSALEAFGRKEPGPRNFAKSDACFKSETPDMIIYASVDLMLEPGGEAKTAFSVGAAKNREEAEETAVLTLQNAGEYSSGHFDMSAVRYEMKKQDISTAMEHLSEMTYFTEKRKDKARDAKPGKTGQKKLWSFGISGDIPIITLEFENGQEKETALRAIYEHMFLKENGFDQDLVFLVSDSGDYRMPAHRLISELLRDMGKEYEAGAFGGVHVVNTSNPDSEAVRYMSACSFGEKEKYIRNTMTLPLREKQPISAGEELRYGFGENGEFIFDVKGRLPQVAWSNILTNGKIGTVTSDAGTGHTWFGNARENKLNRWDNNVMTQKGTATLGLYSEGKFVSLFGAEDGYECRITFSYGRSKWEKKIDGCTVETVEFVPPDKTAKVFIIKAEPLCAGKEIRYCTDLVLGEGRENGAIIKTGFSNGIFSAVNMESGKIAKAAASAEITGYTGDKLSWLEGNMDGFTGAGAIPCMAFSVPAGEYTVIVIGDCSDMELKALTEPENARNELLKTEMYWKHLVEATVINTPDRGLDMYINGWAMYQIIACRMLGRSSMYQSGGAYGFRDQLQDAMAVILSSPDAAKRQILRAAAHQYEEGDVQHWWHPEPDDDDSIGKGVRTTCSDDLLWLPYVLCEYCEKTGDTGFAMLKAGYLSSPPLAHGQHDRYEQPSISETVETLLSHCARAVEQVLSRGIGRNGLLKMGGGDWNDGMNMVGAGGMGESVWLTWFFIIVCRRLGALTDSCGGDGGRYLLIAENMMKAAEQAWNGEWYLRGYYDNGEKLGGRGNVECAIDSVSQSFAVFAGADMARCRRALENSQKYLIDENEKVVRLFTPPFNGNGNDPGYIRGYCPGFRENGGQYTHGAIWLGMAMLKAGMCDEGFDVLRMLLPYCHNMEAYKAEPFVLPADVYYNTENIGRGGWTWYTGAAGWYYRAVTEELLGIKVRGGRVFVEPRIPSYWQGFSARLDILGKNYNIQVKRREKGLEVTINGECYEPENGYAHTR